MASDLQAGPQDCPAARTRRSVLEGGQLPSPLTHPGPGIHSEKGQDRGQPCPPSQAWPRWHQSPWPSSYSPSSPRAPSCQQEARWPISLPASVASMGLGGAGAAFHPAMLGCPQPGHSLPPPLPSRHPALTVVGLRHRTPAGAPAPRSGQEEWVKVRDPGDIHHVPGSDWGWAQTSLRNMTWGASGAHLSLSPASGGPKQGCHRDP